jgi:CDP-diacylglycerol--glycerol-3-phosphate 3-phosphatidyltransferase
MANVITTIRIICGIIAFCLIVSSHYTLAFVVFSLGAISDWFDGSVARSSKSISEFGKVYDPFADKILVLTAVMGLLYKHLLNPYAATFLMIRELSVSFLRSIAKDKDRGAILSGKVKAFFEMLSIIVILLGFVKVGNMLFDIGLLFAYISLYGYIKRWLYE